MKLKFLYSTVSTLKSIVGMVLNTSPSFRSYCPCWTSASVLGCFGTGWLQLSAVNVGCALLLHAVGFALLGSFHHCSRTSMFFSCGPRILVALLHSFHHRLVGCGSVSDSLTTGSLAVWFRLCYFVVVYDSLVRSGFLPTPLLSMAPFVIDGSR